MIRHNQKFKKVVLFINESTVALINDAIIWTDEAISIAKCGENLPRFTIWEDHLCRFFVKDDCLFLYTGTISEHNIIRTEILYENSDLHKLIPIN